MTSDFHRTKLGPRTEGYRINMGPRLIVGIIGATATDEGDTRVDGKEGHQSRHGQYPHIILTSGICGR